MGLFKSLFQRPSSSTDAVEEQINLWTKLSTDGLFLQTSLFAPVGPMPARAMDEFSLGYVMNFTIGLMRRGNSPSKEVFRKVAEVVYYVLFGKDVAGELWKKACVLAKAKNEMFELGMSFANRDLDILTTSGNSNRAAMSWWGYVTEDEKYISELEKIRQPEDSLDYHCALLVKEQLVRLPSESRQQLSTDSFSTGYIVGFAAKTQLEVAPDDDQFIDKVLCHLFGSEKAGEVFDNAARFALLQVEEHVTGLSVGENDAGLWSAHLDEEHLPNGLLRHFDATPKE